MSALVLAENEVTYQGEYDHWRDTTGVSYQFPNQYKSKIKPGVRFIYYRGVRRSNNKRGQAEYFGTGRIADVWRDDSISENEPKAKWRWYCSIEEYIPFDSPVPSKIGGKYLEDISSYKGWRTGVRNISDDLFDKILTFAGLTSSDDSQVDTPLPPLPAPNIEQVVPIELSAGLDGLLSPSNLARKPSNGTSIGYRRSKRSKQIGDRAEEIALKWLMNKLLPAQASSVTWLAQQGKTPGWDIEFTDENGTLIAVEVKGTTGGIFQSIELTAQEWNAAKNKRHHFWLVLVANCLSSQPKVSLIRDPFTQFEAGMIEVEPVVWRIRRS
jgi:hypothetical protein